MKLALAEYLSILKEEGELDSLICDLLYFMDIRVPIKPKKGSRQYGVDILAVGKDPEDNFKQKLFIITVKQGDLNRTTWSQALTGVRASLDDIHNVFIETHLSPLQKALPKKIVVAFNGEFHQSIALDWGTYLEKHSVQDRLEFDYWDLSDLALKMNEHMVSESLFPESNRRMVSKALAFMDIPDANLEHSYKMIDMLIDGIQFKKKKNSKKQLRLLIVFQEMLNRWSRDLDNLKLGIETSEYGLLKLWDVIRDGHFKEKYVGQAYFRLVTQFRKLCIEYVNKISPVLWTQDGLSKNTGNSIEYSLLVWEQIGVLSMAGLVELHYGLLMHDGSNLKDIQVHFENSQTIGEYLVALLNNNPPSKYPMFDEHMIEISLAFLLLVQTNHKPAAEKWISDIGSGLIEQYRLTGFFPLLTSDENLLFDIQFGEAIAPLESSSLVSCVLELMAILSLEVPYDALISFLPKDFKKVDFQLWFPDSETEEQLYSKRAMNTGTAYLIEWEGRSMSETMTLIEQTSNNYDFNEFSCSQHGVFFLFIIASRHFRTYTFPELWRDQRLRGIISKTEGRPS